MMFETTLLIFTSVLATGQAHEASPEDAAQAKTLFGVASRAYEAGDFRMAILAFEQAYRLEPRPQIAFSMAQAYRQQFYVDSDPTKLERAIELYRAYLAAEPEGRRHLHASQHVAGLSQLLQGFGPTARRPPSRRDVVQSEAKTQLMITAQADEEGASASVDGGDPVALPALLDVQAGRRTVRVSAAGYEDKTLEILAVDGRLVGLDAVLEPKPALLRVSAPDGAEVTIDGRVEGTTPFQRPLELREGRHFVAVTQRGMYADGREVELRKGQEETVVVELEETTQRTVSYVFLGTGAALVAGSALLLVAALGHQSKALEIERGLQDSRSLTVAEVNSFNASRQKRDDAVVGAGLLGSAALVAGGVGVLLYLIDNPRVPNPDRSLAPQNSDLAVTPAFTAAFAGAVMSTTF